MKYMLLLRHEPGTGPAENTPEYDAEMAKWGQVMGELAPGRLDDRRPRPRHRGDRHHRAHPQRRGPRHRRAVRRVEGVVLQLHRHRCRPTSTPPWVGPRRCRTRPTARSRSGRCPATSRTLDRGGRGHRAGVSRGVDRTPRDARRPAGRRRRAGRGGGGRCLRCCCRPNGRPGASPPDRERGSPPSPAGGPSTGCAGRPPRSTALDHLETLMRDEDDHDSRRPATTSAAWTTTDCGCCSPAATPPSPWRPGWRSPSECSAGWRCAEVARALLTTETTMYQRLVRAKRKVKAAGIPYRVPGRR